VGHARARRIPAQLVEDEDYQLRYERVAGIDVAKAKADVCTRLPAAREGGRRSSRVEEVGATAGEVLALAARLIADGVQLDHVRMLRWECQTPGCGGVDRRC
jgi:hypothetical protein